MFTKKLPVIKELSSSLGAVTIQQERYLKDPTCTRYNLVLKFNDASKVSKFLELYRHTYAVGVGNTFNSRAVKLLKALAPLKTNEAFSLSGPSSKVALDPAIPSDTLVVKGSFVKPFGNHFVASTDFHKRTENINKGVL